MKRIGIIICNLLRLARRDRDSSDSPEIYGSVREAHILESHENGRARLGPDEGREGCYGIL